MGGLVAGCAIADFSEKSGRVRLVALTVNNACNLQCPHCYLQYAKPTDLFSQSRIERLVDQEFEHLAIVGMEPFLNRETAARTIEIARSARAAGKTVSAITNGVGLNLLSADDARLFKYVDVSFDGGPRTYQQFRGASYERVARNVQAAAHAGLPINGISVVYRQNMGNLDDMLAVLDDLPLNKLMLAPFMPAQADGPLKAGQLPVLELMPLLARNERFLRAPQAFLLLDSYHLASENITWAMVRTVAERHNITNKVHMVPHTPLLVGSLRVTYDGLVLAPRDALHPSHYAASALSFDKVPLQSAYDRFCRVEQHELERPVAAE